MRCKKWKLQDKEPWNYRTYTGVRPSAKARKGSGETLRGRRLETADCLVKHS